MKKKARKSLILIVVLIIILGLGFGFYRIFFVPRPLKMRKLEGMYIIRPRSNHEWGWGLYVIDIESDTAFGSVYDNGNTYQKGNSYARLRDALLQIGSEDEEINIPAGDRLEITYDGGQRLLIYLPRITGLGIQEGINLYVATDGSTYYDEGLTKLAQKAFRG